MLPNIWLIISWQLVIVVTPASLKKLFKSACRADIEAIKPGNVSVHSDAHGMNGEDFVTSANACADAICAPQSSLGERILNAVSDTRKAVAVNTNLGIILLCAPLIQAVYLNQPNQSIRQSLKQVLANTTVDDARYVYRAIRRAEAGGLGVVEQADISTNPDISLLKAMQLARRRDLIAAQYATDYRDIFECARPALLAFYSRWGYNCSAVSGIYMKLLATYPDSLITRKRGEVVAREICSLASALYERYCCSDEPEDFDMKLLEFDHKLKDRNINPGTTADLTVATVFLAALE